MKKDNQKQKVVTEHPVVVERNKEDALAIIEQSMTNEKTRLQERVERIDSSLQEGDAFSKAMKGSKEYLETRNYSIHDYSIKEETRQARILYKVYKEFYGKEPDLSHANRWNLTIEMQAMAFLLAHYRIIFVTYSFSCNEFKNLYMPISMDLQDALVYKLLGRTKEEVDSDLMITEKGKKAIQLLGSKITAAINEKEDPIEALRLIVATYHTEERVLPGASVSEIAEHNKCTVEEVESARALAKTLETELSENK